MFLHSYKQIKIFKKYETKHLSLWCETKKSNINRNKQKKKKHQSFKNQDVSHISKVFKSKLLFLMKKKGKKHSFFFWIGISKSVILPLSLFLTSGILICTLAYLCIRYKRHKQSFMPFGATNADFSPPAQLGFWRGRLVYAHIWLHLWTLSDNFLWRPGKQV